MELEMLRIITWALIAACGVLMAYMTILWFLHTLTGE